MYRNYILHITSFFFPGLSRTQRKNLRFYDDIISERFFIIIILFIYNIKVQIPNRYKYNTSIYQIDISH